ncbi:MAG: phage shock protein E [Patiriisocius sp.]|jgi:phage shock protein E
MIFEEINLAKATIIDVRTALEFSKGHVIGATNIPLDQVEERIDEFKKIQGNIVLCCLSGSRSGNATKHLLDLGLDNVYNGGGWGILNLQVLNVL